MLRRQVLRLEPDREVVVLILKLLAQDPSELAWRPISEESCRDLNSWCKDKVMRHHGNLEGTKEERWSVINTPTFNFEGTLAI